MPVTLDLFMVHLLPLMLTLHVLRVGQEHELWTQAAWTAVLDSPL